MKHNIQQTLVDLAEDGTLCDFAVSSVQHDKILIYENLS
jgi:hypothetical protein